MAQLLTDVSISSYLDRQPNARQFHVHPHSELVMLHASHLARERRDYLNGIYVAWAMLRVNGSIAKDLLTVYNLTEEKFTEACAIPSLHQLNLNRFFFRVVNAAQVRQSNLIGTEHVLAAALTDGLLRAWLTVWDVDVKALYQQASTLTLA
jgi:hypothetical protein